MPTIGPKSDTLDCNEPASIELAAAPRSAAQGADTIVWLATLGANGPTGRFFSDRKPIAW